MAGLELMGRGRRHRDVHHDRHGAGYASACTGWCRAWASGRSSTPRRPRSGLSGSVRNDSSGAIIEVEGDHRRHRTTSSRGCATDRRRWPSSNRLRHRRCPASRRHRIHHRRHVAVRRRPHAGLPRRRDVRRLRGRTTRPRQPALPPRLRQLHQLRPALHDHRVPALRPRLHHDGVLRDVRRLRPRIHRPRRPALPCPAGLLPELRTGAALPRRRRRPDRTARSALPRARQLLRDGGILAVKGIGGYHLACDASNEQAVAELRRRKRRGDKPFAVMVPDLPTARAIADVDDPSARHAVRPAATDRADAPPTRCAAIADSVAPHNPDLGVMLAYTPLHTLLFGLARRRPRAARAGDDVRQSRRRADLLHRRRCARTAFASRRRLADARPGHPGAVRRLRRAGRRRRWSCRSGAPAVMRRCRSRCRCRCRRRWRSAPT